MNIHVALYSSGAPFTAEPRLTARSVVRSRVCKRCPQGRRGSRGAQLSWQGSLVESIESCKVQLLLSANSSGQDQKLKVEHF